MSFEILNSEIRIKGKKIVNRFAILPTESNCAEPGGLPSGETIRRYKKFAEGGAGLIYCEATAVSSDARARVNQLVLTPENLESWKPLVKTVKETNPDALFLIQLDHGGRLSDPDFSKPVAIYENEKNGPVVLSDRQIEEIIDRFIESAGAAQKAGFDGVEIKICHGFLGTDFIQPINTRPGKYGGSLENRGRFIFKIIEGIKNLAGSDDFLIGLRIPAYESIPGGFGSPGAKEVVEDISEPIAICKSAEKAGVSIISVSAGSAAGNAELIHPTQAYPDGVYRHFGWAAAIAQALEIPVIGAGYSYLSDGGTGLGSLTYWAEKNIRDGNVDIVGLGRQGFADPELPAKVLGNREQDVNYCTACMGCGKLLGEQKPVRCILYKE